MVKTSCNKKYKCLYGVNQYGCCNKKPSVKKTKRCLEASKRRCSPCKYGEDENGCCNKKPTQQYLTKCKQMKRSRSRSKMEQILNNKHLVKKIIKSIRKSRKPRNTNNIEIKKMTLPKSQITKFVEKYKKSIEKKNHKNEEVYKKQNKTIILSKNDDNTLNKSTDPIKYTPTIINYKPTISQSINSKKNN